MSELGTASEATTTTETAPVASVSDFAAFEASENAKDFGKEPPPAATAADTADDPDATHAVTEPAAATSPAAVTATPAKPVSKRQEHINDLARKAAEADQRAAAVLERAEKAEQASALLEARLAALERGKTEPEPAVEPAPVVDPNDPEPDEGSFDTYGEFVKANAKWAVRQAKRELAADAERASTEKRERDAHEAHTQRFNVWAKRRDEFAASQPDFRVKAGPFLERIEPGTPLGDVLMDSPVGPALAWHLVTHPEDLDRIARLGPIQQIRALGKLEAQYDTDSATTSTSASAGPAAKTVTTAPAPPTHLAARTADTGDRARAALDRGDFSAFEAEENRKALAGIR